ncbi:glycoside hydrolase family 32 protein [Lactobacillus xylocopicola]|uniref:Sucrose-6-phosphate hydrolase n=1 Tax=Lactobacillus xylocopicola TaxID=2976676 RepID=A0ABM8BFF5_9LACO|nr:sucrose-6-phosphate hydrolase [Lactobacillus xylocopicola]BDR59841.1 invertase [Lactobacillus xylocopicola]
MRKIAKIINDRYRLNYHVSTPGGWMNDPNGFSYFNGYYHIFYQYHPYSAQKGPMHWGHYRSKDMIHWEELPIALGPNSQADENGCFSGSAIVKDGRLYLIYTGHHYFDKTDHSDFYQTQNIAYSDDGVNFKKYEHNPVIKFPPQDNTKHFRDPKVWRNDNDFYMILGSQDQTGLGRVIMYKSPDLLHWEYLGPLANSSSVEKEGYMWECPDLFSLNGQDVLLCSPQGIEATGEKYLNQFQTGYFVGEMNYSKNSFTHGAFSELDHGHDFYAAQTTLTPDNRRIVIAWFGMWDAEFPEQADGWAGALTLPRELTLKDNHLYMRPITELKSLRKEKFVDLNRILTNEQISVADAQHIELLLEVAVSEWSGKEFALTMKSGQQNLITVLFKKQTSKVIVKRADKAENDSDRYGKLKNCTKLKIRIFIDTSSMEFFFNDGELVFSERYYTETKPSLYFKADQAICLKMIGYTLVNN